MGIIGKSALAIIFKIIKDEFIKAKFEIKNGIISNSKSVTEEGLYCLDAIQNNSSVEGTLAYLINQKTNNLNIDKSEDMGGDLNNYVTPGIYYFNINSIPLNIPNGVVNGWLIVMNAPSRVKQIFFRLGTSNKNDFGTYVRTKCNTDIEWSNWRMLLTKIAGTPLEVTTNISGYIFKGTTVVYTLTPNTIYQVYTHTGGYYFIRGYSTSMDINACVNDARFTLSKDGLKLTISNISTSDNYVSIIRNENGNRKLPSTGNI